MKLAGSKARQTGTPLFSTVVCIVIVFECLRKDRYLICVSVGWLKRRSLWNDGLDSQGFRKCQKV